MYLCADNSSMQGGLNMSHGKHNSFEIHMCYWNFTCESHVKHITISYKGYKKLNLFCSVTAIAIGILACWPPGYRI